MKRYLGVEFGSTRIKAVCIDEKFRTLSCGEYAWKSKYENGNWTYDMSLVLQGLKTVLSQINEPEKISAIGISAMMHGYLAFDKDWNLLTPFRTWQNTTTAVAAKELSEALNVNIPQRWSVAHLYQAVLNGEEHLKNLAHITTLAGYVHYLLTGENVVGIGEASGMFPVKNGDYDRKMLLKAQQLFDKFNINFKIKDVLPKIVLAGKEAGRLTGEGALLLDGMLCENTPFCAPEGDAQTGMVATNCVAEKTGNISVGTSIFSMVVLDKPLKNNYEEIDIVTTPAGKDVAMVHCNNCTADSNAWISVFKEAIDLFADNVQMSDVYDKFYKKSLEGEMDCSGVSVCNYLSGEVITDIDFGRPFVIRKPDSDFTLSNFLRATLYSSFATLKIGMEILKKEGIIIDKIVGHGGIFKTEGVAQRYLAAALNTPITLMKTASEGGPYGMALLAAFAAEKREGETVEEFLQNRVFGTAEKITVHPHKEEVCGFNTYLQEYKKVLKLEKAASEIL